MVKTVFITGASSGLGKGMAQEFAQRGYNLALAARSPLDDFCSQLSNAYGVTVKPYSLDVTNNAAVKTCLDQVVADFGSLDIVVANAGIAITTRIGEGNFDEIKATVDTNITGLMATVEYALPIMRQQGRGQIVGISSVAGERGLPSVGVYSGSKSFVTTYLKALQLECAREPVDVTILAPGYIDTPINQGAKSRPFVITLEKGAKELVDKIERKVAFAFVPGWPWALVARVLRYLPARLLSK